MIYWLASYPRSGNTFARLVLQQMYDVCLPTIYGPPAVAAESQQLPARPILFPELRFAISLDEMRAAPEPLLVKTHELPSDDSPAIYLVRDGRDALVSHAHYILTFDMHEGPHDRQAFLTLLRRLVETDEWFGGWSNNALAWKTRRAPTAIVHFADLIAQPAESLRAAVASLGLQLRERRECVVPNFSELHAREPTFFRRGGVGNWRDEMPADLHELFWQRHGDAMAALGYQRSGDTVVPTHRFTSAA